MNENEKTVEWFYQAVADLLKCPSHKYTQPVRKKNRWNNRHPGNGRYSGHGLVRCFGPNHILVRLHNPTINGVFSEMDEALQAIEKRRG